MNRVLSMVLASSVAALVSSSASAAVIYGDAADARVYNNFGPYSVDSQSAQTIASGDEGYGNQIRSYVSLFQLPNLGAVSNPFSSATVSLKLLSASGTNWVQLRLDALPARASSTVLASDATAGGTSTGLTLTTSAASGTKTTSDLTGFFNTQYAGGAGAGKYVFFSFRPTDFGNALWTFATADNPTVADRPQFTYTVVPEPASFILLGLSAGTLLTLRRRRA